MFSSEKWFGGGADDFYSHTIDQSLRFEDGDNPKLSRTPSSAGNQKTWTWSGWIKRGNLGSEQTFFMAYKGINDYVAMQFDSGDEFNITYKNISQTGGSLSSQTRRKITSAVFRDASAWYNIVVKFDAANTNCDIYVNGEEITDFSVNEEPQNLDFAVNDTFVHYIGASENSVTGVAASHFDGYLAEINLVDGTALDASSFGETKAGIWIPKDTSGLTFGTNGFRLTFEGTGTGTTSQGTTAQTNIGDDQSGGGHNWAVTNIVSTDVVLDSPTNNWATMNPLDGNGPTISEGSLKVFGDTSFSVFEGFKGTFPMSSGKWYWEVYINVGGFTQTGITPTTNTAVISTTNLSYHTDAMTYESNGNKAIGTGGTGTAPTGRTSSSYGLSYTTGDIIGVALDLDSATTTLTFYKNNSSQGTAFSSLASAEYVPVHAGIQNNFGIFNFGQDSSFAGNKTSGSAGASDANGNGDFYYSPPSGYLACCSANLSDPAIDPAQNEEPADYFNTVLYTGDGNTTQNVGATSPYILGFEPDFTWIKSRSSGAGHHSLIDSVRGDVALNSNQTIAEYGVGAFNSNSNGTIDVPYYSNDYSMNTSSTTYVAWNWLAGGSAVTNNEGDLTSSVSANTEAGFSIVSWTANGSNDDRVGHGLSSTPELIIYKERSAVGSWYVWITVIDGTNDYLLLNSTASKTNISSSYTSPTATTISNYGYANGISMIAYCFHSVEGYSKIGTYTGNGSTTGPFVYTGFRPAWLLVKRTDSASTNGWYIYDNKRNNFGTLVDAQLYANLTSADDDGNRDLDFTSNGFKPRLTDVNVNASGGSYIYLAFADQPQKYSNAR
jgi:hypothetical protein